MITNASDPFERFRKPVGTTPASSVQTPPQPILSLEATAERPSLNDRIRSIPFWVYGAAVLAVVFIIAAFGSFFSYHRVIDEVTLEYDAVYETLKVTMNDEELTAPPRLDQGAANKGRGWDIKFIVHHDPKNSYGNTSWNLVLKPWNSYSPESSKKRENLVAHALKEYEDGVTELKKLRPRVIPVVINADRSDGLTTDHAERLWKLLSLHTDLFNQFQKGHGVKLVPCLTGSSRAAEALESWTVPMATEARSKDALETFKAELQKKIFAVYGSQAKTDNSAVAGAITAIAKSDPAPYGYFIVLSDFRENTPEATGVDFERHPETCKKSNYADFDARLFPSGIPDMSSTQVILLLPKIGESKKAEESTCFMGYFTHVFVDLAHVTDVKDFQTLTD
jgi:hypothetical protein